MTPSSVVSRRTVLEVACVSVLVVLGAVGHTGAGASASAAPKDALTTETGQALATENGELLDI